MEAKVDLILSGMQSLTLAVAEMQRSLAGVGRTAPEQPAAPAFEMPVDGRGGADFGPVIEGPLSAWRAAHPHALVANVSGRKDLVDTDFACLRGVRALSMFGCSQPTITDAAFECLTGIHTLDMSGCSQETITSAAFKHLRGIHSLAMTGCYQRTISDAAFAHLRGIHSLAMSCCSQRTLTDAAFSSLAGIHTLDMSGCSQPSITSAAFAYLRGIHTLDMTGCSQPSITNAAFAHLRGIHTLVMSGCSQDTITDAAFEHLSGIYNLDVRESSLAHLAGALTLSSGQHQPPTPNPGALVEKAIALAAAQAAHAAEQAASAARRAAGGGTRAPTAGGGGTRGSSSQPKLSVAHLEKQLEGIIGKPGALLLKLAMCDISAVSVQDFAAFAKGRNIVDLDIFRCVGCTPEHLKALEPTLQQVEAEVDFPVEGLGASVKKIFY